MGNQIIKNIIFYGLAAVMIFAPLIKGAVVFWSLTAIEIVVFALTFLWLLSKNISGNWHFKPTALDRPILICLALAIASAIFTICPYLSLTELLLILAYAFVYYLFVNNFDSAAQFRFTVLIIIIASGLSVLGLGQYFFGLDHSWWKPDEFLASTFVNHNHFAGYLELAVPLCCGLLLGLGRNQISNTTRLFFWRILLTFSLIILAAAFIFTQSRGGWIALTLTFFVYNIMLVRRKRFRKWTLAVYFIALIIGVTFLYIGQDKVAERLRTIEAKGNEASWQAREMIWDGTIKMIKDRPLLGAGVGTFEQGFPRFRPAELDVRANFAHNDYLQAASEMGLLAIPLMLWIIFLILKKGTFRDENDPRLIRNLRLASAIGILSISIHGLVDFNFHLPSNMLLAIFLVAVVMRPATVKSSTQSENSSFADGIGSKNA